MTTTTTENPKPRWVECADKASEILDTARNAEIESKKDAIVREAKAWMELAYLYADRDREMPAPNQS